MIQHNELGSIKDQIQAVLDFAAAGINETQYQMFEDTHNHDCYSSEDRKRFKQNQADYIAGMSVIAYIPNMLAALQDTVKNIEQLAGIVNHFSPGKVRADDFSEKAREAVAKVT